MEIRAVLRDPATFGLQQWLQWFWIACANILTAMHLVASVFISATVDYRCQIPGLDNDTYAIQSTEHNATILEYIALTDDDKYDTCNITHNTGKYSNITQTYACDRYVYDTTQFVDTTVTEFNLVCSSDFLSTAANVIYMAGLFVGSLAFGTVSDKLGRKWTVFIGLCLQGVIALSIRFSPGYEVFVALRFLLGAVSIGGLVTQFILMIEMAPSNKRVHSAICQTLGWCIGVMLLSGLGYAIRNWRDLQLCLACISVPFILTYWWLLTESPRWLLSQGRFEDALAIVQRIKELNKLKDLDIENLVDTEVKEQQLSESWRDVFKARTLLFNILINCFGWLVASMGYYGLTLNVGNLVGDIYVNNFIGGLVEVPAYILLLVCMKIGRKYVYIALMLIGGIALVVSAFLLVYIKDEAFNWVIVTVSMIGKFAVSAGFELIYFWSAETYPTSMRNSMVGLNSASARIGGMLSPVIADLPNLAKGVPFAKGITPLVFGGFMIAAAGMALLLPETNRIPIPETIEEANALTYNYSGSRKYIAKSDAIGEVEMTSKGVLLQE